MASELGDTILERDFEALDTNGNSGTITLRVGKPYLASESSRYVKWRCPFQITGIGSDNIKEGPGIDAIDSLLATLQIAEFFLKSYSRTSGTKITWQGEEELGFHHLSSVEAEDQGIQAMEIDDSPFKEVFEEFFRNLDKKSGDTPE